MEAAKKTQNLIVRIVQNNDYLVAAGVMGVMILMVLAFMAFGTPVIIAGSHTDPVSLADSGPILGTGAEKEIEAKLGKKQFAPSSPDAVTSILVG